MTDSGDNFIGTGTIVFLSFEGGFYGIKADDGKSYDPINLPAEFCREGMRVRFEAKELPNMASFHMWGIIVQIVHIQAL
jgi:inhibitor of cysteine peptidase